MALTAAVLEVLVRANTTQASAALARTQAQLKATGAAAQSSATRMTDAYNRAGTRTSAVGRKLTTHLALPAAAVGAASVKMAMDFEESMLRVQTLAGVSEKTMHKFTEEVLALAPAVGKAPQELAEALYFISSSGIKASDAMEVLETTAKASAVGLGETETVADAVTSAMNAYRRSNLDAAAATEVLMKTVKFGKGEPEELAASIGRVIPVASKLKVPFNDVGSSLAGLTLQGLDAAEATTALRGVFMALLKPTADGEEALGKVGLSAQTLRDILEKKGTLAMLTRLSTEFKGNEEAMAKVFPNVRALVGAFNLTGDSAKKNAQIFKDMTKNTDFLGKQFKATEESEVFKFNAALSELRVSAIKLGTVLLPVVNKLVKGIASIATAFSSVPGWAQGLLLGSAIVLGPIIAMVGWVLKLAAAWKAVRTSATTAGAAQTGATAAGGAGGRAAAAGAAGAGAAGAAKGAKVAGTSWGKMFGGAAVIAMAVPMRQEARNLTEQMLGDLGKDLIGFSDKLTKLPGLGQWLDPIGNVENLLKPLTEGQKKVQGFGQAFDVLGQKVRRVGGVTNKEMKGVTSSVEQGSMKSRRAFARNFDGVTDKARDSMRKTKDRTSEGMQSITALMESKLKAFGFKGSITEAVKELLPGFQRGGALVGGSGSGDKVHAMLEPGEVVWNREAVKAMGGTSAANTANRQFPRFAKGGVLPSYGSNYVPGLVGARSLNLVAGAGEKLLKEAKGGNLAGISDLVVLGHALQKMGYQVGEHPAFGGVTPGAHSATGYHPRGRALDVNHGAGQSAAEMAALDKIFGPLSKNKNVVELLWRVEDHFDHLHVAMARGGIVQDFARAGVDTKASKKAMFALFMAGLAESGMRDLSYGHSSSEGVLQLLDSTAAGYGISPHDEYGVAKGFLTHGYWGRGGANSLANRVGSAAMIAHLVQGNATGTGVYSAQAGAARSLLQGAGLKFPNDKAKWAKGGGKKSGKTSDAPAKFNVDKLPLSAKQKALVKSAFAKMGVLPGKATTAGELADRAADLEGLVGGRDEASYLREQLDYLWAYRNWLVIVHNLITKAVETMNEQIAKMKSGKGKKKLKEIRNLANAKLTEVGGKLTEVQGTVVGADPFKRMKNLPSTPGMFGGTIFETQMRLKDLGAETGTVAETTNLTSSQLKELGYLSTLGVKFNPSQFAGFFAGGGVLGAGQWGIAGERGPEAVVGPAAISPGGAINVRVFIGDRELTDIVRVETDGRDRGARGAYMAGRGAR